MNAFDENSYVSNTTINRKIIDDCFKAQGRINPLFDNHQDKEYLQARSILYPESIRGSKDFKNRAGDKLFEMLQMARIQINDIHYMADICSIPGSWTLAVIQRNKQAKSILLSKKILDKKDYYGEIKQSPNCYIVEGVNGGDVYQTDSLVQYMKKVQEITDIKKENPLIYTPGLDIFLGDGGFQINLYDKKHVEHLQETITQRLFLSQILYGIYSIKQDASMIIKCFDLCSNFNIQLLHLVGCLFKQISIIKTEHSRITNSERYVIFHNLEAKEEQINQTINILLQFYNNYKDNCCFKQIYNKELTETDSYIRFQNKINEISEILMKKQSESLNKVVNKTYEILSQQKRQ